MGGLVHVIGKVEVAASMRECRAELGATSTQTSTPVRHTAQRLADNILNNKPVVSFQGIMSYSWVLLDFSFYSC